MNNLDLIYTITSDKLRLPGIHFIPENPTDICLLVIHGMSGNILENYWGDVLGRYAVSQGVGCIFSHNRGFGQISDPSYVNSSKNLHAGAVYERFSDCVLDIDSWVGTTRSLGYSRIILLGHSLGGPKVIKYMSEKNPTEIVKVILASAADMVGLFYKDEPNAAALMSEAQSNISSDQPEKLLSSKIWDWYFLSSQTLVDLFSEHGPADLLPIIRNPDVYPELASIKVPVLAFYGEHDDSYVLSTPQADLDRMKSKATNTPTFTTAIIPGANHVYLDKEKEMSAVVLSWIKSQ
ncbi:MAG: alpha/beta hydrolase [Patescibacteria group bacterium]